MNAAPGFWQMLVTIVLVGSGLLGAVASWEWAARWIREAREGRRDTARLDWLTITEHEVRRMANVGVWSVSVPHGHVADLGRGPSPRHAIDQAMANWTTYRHEARQLMRELRDRETAA